MRKRPLFLCACVFVIGLLAFRYQRYELLLIIVGWLGYEVLCCKISFGKRYIAGRSILLLSAFFLGYLHMMYQMAFRETCLSRIEDGKMGTVWGEVVKVEFKEENRYHQIFLSNCYLNLNGETLPCNDVIVYSSNDQYMIGEIHKINGKLHMFETARNEGGFDSRMYYQSLKIDFAVYETEHKCMRQNTSELRQSLLSFREKVKGVYAEYTTERTAGFLTGMVIGDKSGLQKDLKDLFTDGGIAHILAISGLHVSIIGRGWYRILRNRRMGFVAAGICAGMVLIVYLFLTGSGMSSVRAGGMLFIFFGAQMLGRSYDMLNSLGAMVLFLLWQNPFYIENSGFWFSVLAIIGVGFVGSIWGSFGMSVGITLTTLPLVALGYYEIPLYAPLINFLLLPLLAPIFVLALLGGNVIKIVKDICNPLL